MLEIRGKLDGIKKELIQTVLTVKDKTVDFVVLS